MIYLSWSIVHLITVFALICFGGFVAYKKHVDTKKILDWVCLLIGLVEKKVNTTITTEYV